MQGVKIESKDKKIICQCSYYPAFHTRAHELGGVWTGPDWKTFKLTKVWKEPFWTFDVREENQVRDLCFEIYGTDGRDVPCVTVHYRVNCEVTNCIYLLGRGLVWRMFSSGSIRFGYGVLVFQGGFREVFSTKRGFSLKPEPDTILKIIDAPISLVQKAILEYPDRVFIVDNTNSSEVLTSELVDQLSSFSTEVLRSELERRFFLET